MTVAPPLVAAASPRPSQEETRLIASPRPRDANNDNLPPLPPLLADQEAIDAAAAVASPQPRDADNDDLMIDADHNNHVPVAVSPPRDDNDTDTDDDDDLPPLLAGQEALEAAATASPAASPPKPRAGTDLQRKIAAMIDDEHNPLPATVAALCAVLDLVRGVARRHDGVFPGDSSVVGAETIARNLRSGEQPVDQTLVAAFDKIRSPLAPRLKYGMKCIMNALGFCVRVAASRCAKFLEVATVPQPQPQAQPQPQPPQWQRHKTIVLGLIGMLALYKCAIVPITAKRTQDVFDDIITTVATAASDGTIATTAPDVVNVKFKTLVEHVGGTHNGATAMCEFLRALFAWVVAEHSAAQNVGLPKMASDKMPRGKDIWIPIANRYSQQATSRFQDHTLAYFRSLVPPSALARGLKIWSAISNRPPSASSSSAASASSASASSSSASSSSSAASASSASASSSSASAASSASANDGLVRHDAFANYQRTVTSLVAEQSALIDEVKGDSGCERAGPRKRRTVKPEPRLECQQQQSSLAYALACGSSMPNEGNPRKRARAGGKTTKDDDDEGPPRKRRL